MTDPVGEAAIEIADAVDDIAMSCHQFSEKDRDPLGIFIQVAVHHEDVVACRVGETRHNRLVLPIVAGKIDDDNVRVVCGNLLGFGKVFVRALAGLLCARCCAARTLPFTRCA